MSTDFLTDAESDDKYFEALKKPRGGARPGAGRPPSGRTTVNVRVPSQWGTPAKIASLIQLANLVNDWHYQSSQASDTSPRWERLRDMLSEVEAQTTVLSDVIPF